MVRVHVDLFYSQKFRTPASVQESNNFSHRQATYSSIWINFYDANGFHLFFDLNETLKYDELIYDTSPPNMIKTRNPRTTWRTKRYPKVVHKEKLPIKYHLMIKSDVFLLNRPSVVLIAGQSDVKNFLRANFISRTDWLRYPLTSLWPRLNVAGIHTWYSYQQINNFFERSRYKLFMSTGLTLTNKIYTIIQCNHTVP